MSATGIFTVLSVPLLIVIPLALAIALNKKFRGRNAMRAVFFAPFVLGVAVIGLLWRYLLDPNVGVVNYYLDALGFDRIPFTTATPWVWLALVVPTIWWTAGYNMVIFLAGLQDISTELYEAAELDGASAWQRFRHVTLPGLRPVMVFVLTITILASANLFGQPYLITQGQPGEETRTAIMQIGEEGLRNFNMGSASAMSTMLTVVLLAISLLSLSFMRERKGEEAMSSATTTAPARPGTTTTTARAPQPVRMPWRVLFLGLLALFFLAPLLWMLTTSLKTRSEVSMRS